MHIRENDDLEYNRVTGESAKAKHRENTWSRMPLSGPGPGSLCLLSQTSALCDQIRPRIPVFHMLFSLEGWEGEFIDISMRCVSCSVVSDSLRPHRLYATGLLCPRDFPGKDTGMGCHFFLQGIFLSQGSNPCLLVSCVSCIASGLITTDPLGSACGGKPYFHGRKFLLCH